MSHQLSLDYYDDHESREYLAESFGHVNRFMRHVDKPNFVKCSACGRIVPERETEAGACSECNYVDNEKRKEKK
jgi:hypothetical protein